MFRSRCLLFCVFVISGISAVEAQHHHGGNHHQQQPYRGYVPIIVGPAPVWISNPAPPSIAVLPVVHKTPTDGFTDPAKHPVKPSTPAARLKSLEFQSRGDEKFRKQLWAQAYVSYRSAADVATDRGEAHFRLGFVYTAMQYYPSAIREFKRGLFLSPELAATGIRISMLFGPDSEIVRTSILHKVVEWVQEDLNDPDRLFLLGLLLHFEDDPRRRPVLDRARKLAGARNDHIRALLDQPDVPVAAGVKKLPVEIPEIPEAANPAPHPPAAIPGLNPVPAALPQVGPPHPPPPIGLPMLNNKATPPIVPAPVAGNL